MSKLWILIFGLVTGVVGLTLAVGYRMRDDLRFHRTREDEVERIIRAHAREDSDIYEE